MIFRSGNMDQRVGYGIHKYSEKHPEGTSSNMNKLIKLESMPVEKIRPGAGVKFVLDLGVMGSWPPCSWQPPAGVVGGIQAAARARTPDPAW
jgi:hypothetical protein